MSIKNLFITFGKVSISIISLILLLGNYACKDATVTNENNSGNNPEEKLFSSIPANESGIDFQNRLAVA